MALFDLAIWGLLIGFLLATGIALITRRQIRGFFRLWRFMNARQKNIQQRMEESVSHEESRALEVVMETLADYRRENVPRQGDFRFLPDTLSLVSRIAEIYYPNEKAPMEKARIGNLLTAFQEMNRQILAMLELPELETLTQFRLREVLPGVSATEKTVAWVPAYFRRWLRLRVVLALRVQWALLVGEAAIKVYGEHRAEEIPEPETLLDEMDRLREEPGPSLPDEVRDIVEKSRKDIMFSVTPLPWAKVKPIYISLAENIARFWHPRSSAPLYEVRIYDLLNGLADYLEWAGQLSKKPVLNKMLGLRISHLTGVKEVALPFYPSWAGKPGLNIMPDNKIFGWMHKYQVGRAAKWSRTIFKTLRKKQPAILFRDVVIGLVKEGGKRWLILSLHDKIAGETNTLYKGRIVGRNSGRSQKESRQI